MSSDSPAHKVEIIFDERFIARPYGLKCSQCGVFGCQATLAEAEASKAIHEARADEKS